MYPYQSEITKRHLPFSIQSCQVFKCKIFIITSCVDICLDITSFVDLCLIHMIASSFHRHECVHMSSCPIEVPHTYEIIHHTCKHIACAYNIAIISFFLVVSLCKSQSVTKCHKVRALIIICRSSDLFRSLHETFIHN